MHAHCSSGGCGNHAPWPCPCPPAGNARLADAAQLVACFQQTQGGLAAEAAFYTSLATPAEALYEALQALADEIGLHPGNQALTRPAIEATLAALRPQIEELAAQTDFVELHASFLLYAGLAGLTPLAAYDSALRFGLRTGVAPTQVFIHDANREAAGHLRRSADVNNWVDPQDFPAELQQLAAAEIELCLSLCQNQWNHLATKTTATEIS